MSDRFFTAEPLSQGEFTLDGSEAHHLAHVRRLQVGDRVVLFNGDGRQYPAQILSVEKKRVHLNITGIESPSREIDYPIHIATALPKGDRADFLIEKLTEFGVTDVTPLVTMRSIVIPKSSLVEKWQRAVIEASKQCGRNKLLRVHSPLPFEKWIAIGDFPATRWIAHPGGAVDDTSTVERNGLAAAVGPEGGFTPEELELAKENGFVQRSLGPRILRVETAAIYLATRGLAFCR